MAGPGEVAGFPDGVDPRRYLVQAEECADQGLTGVADALDSLHQAEEKARRAEPENPELAARLLEVIVLMRTEVGHLARAFYLVKDFTESQLYLWDTLEDTALDVGWPELP